jgi:hypothetical protein
MCNKTFLEYTCGCIKLKRLTFCTWVDSAEHLVRDNGMHHYGEVRKFDIIVYLKSAHDSHAPDDTVSVDDDGDEERITKFVEMQFEELRGRCERDTVLSTEKKERGCEVCERWALPEGVVYVGKGLKSTEGL